MRFLHKLSETDKKEYTFEKFIALESNIAAKKTAIDFVSDKSGSQTLVISSTIGNGATHLATAILNRCEAENENKEAASISFDSLCEYYDELDFDILNNKSALLIDSYYESKRMQPKLLTNIIENVKTKIIITCTDQVNIPLESQCISLICPQHYEMKVILENLLSEEKYSFSEDIISYIADQNLESVRYAQSFMIMLSAYGSLNRKAITLDIARNKMTEFLEKIS